MHRAPVFAMRKIYENRHKKETALWLPCLSTVSKYIWVREI